MDQSRFARLSTVMSGLGDRRAALTVAAVSGLALASQTVAAKNDARSERKKRRRRGKRGKQGPAGPAAGAGAVLEKKTCAFNPDDSGDVGTSEGCQAPCPAGHVAVGGGFEGPTFIDAIGHVISSYPTQSGQNPPDGWETMIEFLDFGQQFEVTTYVICLPA